MTNVYNRGKFIVGAEVLPGGLVLRAMLVKSAFAYNVDDNVVADIDTDEIVGAGYARVTLGSVTWAEDDTNDRAHLDAARAAFGSIAIGETVTDCVIFEQDNGSSDVAANDGLVARITLTNTPTNGQAFSVDFGGTNPGAFLRINDV